MDPESRNGVIKDLEDGICLIATKCRRCNQVAGQLGPMCTTDGTGDTTMADIRGNASEVERMRTLGCEYGLAWTGD